MTTRPVTDALRVDTDRRAIRSRWHSQRFIVARITAPTAEAATTRPPVNLAFVLDRSGSMTGEKLRLAAQAVEAGIGRLQPTDRFSVIWYDGDVDVLVPGTFADPDARRRAIELLRGVRPGGSTNLSGGWLAGCEQVATRLLDVGVNRALVLTDGLANNGITDGDELARHAAELQRRGVTTSTFGVGDQFDEVLLQGMATAGGGNFHDIADATRIPDQIGIEVGEALEVVARDVELRLTLPDDVRVECLGTFPVRRVPGGAVVLVGDLVSGQSVEVTLRVSFPLGQVGATVPAIVALVDRDGVFGDAHGRIAWEYASDVVNDTQPRDRAVDRVVATMFAARARAAAVRHNREGDYARAREVLEATARRIRSYAGEDAILRRIADELAGEVETFRAAMPERARKVAFAQSNYRLASRDASGAAMRQR
ncbi:MAG: VWA domain-containing protein [Chloroflexi bacterium]|nr:VWA domain-containing protein [Chloroflexota bacterium]